MVEPTPQSLKDLAESAIKELTPLISTKKMNVITKFGKLPKISVDKKLMYIIFQNLFSNAVKYTPEGGKVKIELSKEGSHVLITVADSGMGIPKEEIGKLFEKLFRASNAKEKAIEGTGLGLYMIKEILESTGGKIEVASELGKGSVFSVKMPLAGMKAKVGSKKLI